MAVALRENGFDGDATKTDRVRHRAGLNAIHLGIQNADLFRRALPPLFFRFHRCGSLSLSTKATVLCKDIGDSKHWFLVLLDFTRR